METEKAQENRPSGAKNEDEILLGVLNAVHRESAISQRAISREVGVALGLANAYLKRCVRKGWIKVRQVPRRRYIYYLTARGFAEKTRLTGEYLSASFNFFRRARAQMSELTRDCANCGWRRIAFVGASDLAEIGIICAQEAALELVGVIEAEPGKDRFCGLPVYPDLAACPPVDAVVVTAFDEPGPLFEQLRANMAIERILVPTMLRSALVAARADVDNVEVAV
jgi:DNA-binding MarR family transcriptional regulator